MTAMKLQLVLCFLLGLYSLSSAYRQYEARFQQKAGGYVHAGRVEVYIDGHWGTICASDWDMNDAEVVCKELGKGYANTITVTGGTPQGAGTHCLSRVNCYGHESRLSDCEVTPSTRVSSTSDKGIVCYPPTSEAGIKLIYGPDQYSGLVEVKLASGSWSPLFYAWWSASEWSTRPKPASICRQLGFGELDWWDVYVHTSNVGMTYVYSCAYGIADHRSCTYSSLSNPYRAFVGCHKPGSIPCSAPYVPHHATVDHLRVNYNFGDRVNVTCDTSDANFTLQCHNKGLWSGPVVSCPEPDPPSPAYCSAPSVPPDSTIQNRRLTYKNGDNLNVTCNNGPDSFELNCVYGIWNGQNIVCPDPVTECNPPIIPVASSIEKIKPRYKVGDEVNITCNDGSDWFIWECQRDSMWRGRIVQCSVDLLPPAGEAFLPTRRMAPSVDKQDGIDFFVTGLLVTAVILFVMVLMCMAVFFIYVRNRSHDFTFSRSSKDTLQDEKGDRGPLPDVPDGYANYIVGDQELYVEPYLKPSADDPQSYETFEKPV